MAIEITQPFKFDSNQPNFDRDVINTGEFTSQSPYNLTQAEMSALMIKYDDGHSVWDVNTKKRYTVRVQTISGVTIVTLEPAAPVRKTTQEWYDLDNTYIPYDGEIIIFTDHSSINNSNVPEIKIGDGVTRITQLPFLGCSEAYSSEVAERVAHKLHIGNIDYDGSEEKTVPVYNGDAIIIG